MKDWVVVVPSYGRVELFKKKTLATLQRYKVPKDRIYVFVANEEENKAYTAGIGRDVGHIVTGIKGLPEIRDFIFDYFPKGQPIVSFDDDVTGFIERVNDKKKRPLRSLVALFDRGFAACEKAGASFWGVYPITNPYFMKDGHSTDFKFIIGSFWGCFNPKSDIRMSKANGGIGAAEKEDYARTIQFWTRDGTIVRINDVALQTATYKSPGGLQEGNRLERERKTVKAMLRKWPQFIAENPRRKSGYPELRLIRQTRKKD